MGDILDRFFWHPLAHSLVDGGRVPIAVIVFDFLLHQPSEDRGLAEISYQRFYLDLYESKLIDKSGAYIVLTDLGKFAVISRNNKSWYREVIEILRDNKTIAWTVGIIGLIAALVTLVVEGPDVFRRFFGGH